MWSGSAACASAESDELPASNMRAFFDVEAGEVHVERHQAEAVIDDDAVAFVIETSREHNAAGVHCEDTRAGAGVIVQSSVNACEFPVEDATCAERIGLRRDFEGRTKRARP
jgi:hypothetical protein